MPPRKTPSRDTTSGNFISEWFGHTVWPKVDGSRSAEVHQRGELCPFLGAATGEQRPCVKLGDGKRTGVCTISSDSNGVRQDWLACPYRTLDQHFTLLGGAVRTAFRVPERTAVHLYPVTILHEGLTQERIRAALEADDRVFLFSADKLGGEVDLAETDASPGAKVDVSVIELRKIDPLTGEPEEFGQHLFYEIQTADFHGSPLHAVKLLREACSTGADQPFHQRLQGQVEVCGTGVEGPNKSNVFKRTIYQMIFKIQTTQHAESAGFCLVIPVPVWESWLRHLGRPQLEQAPHDAQLLYLFGPDERKQSVLEPERAWIFVFDIDRESSESPRPLKVIHRIATSSIALVHYAFQTAAERAIAAGVIDSFRATLESRIREGWRGRLRRAALPRPPGRAT